MRVWMEKWSLKTKLMMAFILIIIVNIIITTFYTGQMFQMISFQQSSQQEYFHVRDISNAINQINYTLDNYMKNPSLENLDFYRESCRQASNRIQVLQEQSHTTSEWYMVHAIQNASLSMITYYDCAVEAVQAKQTDYYLDYYAGQKINQYIPGYVNEYLNLLVEKNSVQTDQLEKKALYVGRVSQCILVVGCILLMLFAAFFSNWITKPIRALSETAKRISRGELALPDVPVIHDDEIGALTRTFNVMKDDISLAIQTLLHKAELEERLHEEEMKNIKNVELLKEARYLALQSQVNPHFLFNTLNAIARAIAHEPKETAIQLVCCLADLFRYNLDHLNTYSTLGEELHVVDQYMFIQNHRFEERIDYRVEGAAGFERILVPSMLVQPLVENSLIHGIEDLEYGGMILVKISQRHGRLRLRVYDNGVGMKRIVREQVCADVPRAHTGHTTGIGLSNLRQRVNMMPGGRMKISSAPGKGTLVEISIPLDEQEEKDV